ncbi:hypothetical protein QAD02_015085 [Eretmocerus hayati]|uniref:Uncharacterized protein n=1 Tax=Eretmocerus hayati TaxID=131215 RepID=A0ACC2P7B8_9HYME|nr:hypothetical protein QAD02_015085 [Eretmocerus hayati]
MEQVPRPQPDVAPTAVLKVRLWLSGAPGGFWPKEDDIADPSLSSKATIADSESTTESLMQEDSWPTSDSGRSSRLSLQEEAPQSIRPRGTASPADAATLQHVHEHQPMLTQTLIHPPHGHTPRMDPQHTRRDISPSYAASLSKALLKIRIQYASSDEGDASDSASEQNGPRDHKKTQESSSSAYSSGEEDCEGEGPYAERRLRKSARARSCSFPLRLHRRSRAERAARNAAWQWSVTEQSPCYNYAPAIDTSNHACAPISDPFSAPKPVFEPPLFFVYPPSEANMPVVPEEVYALAKNYWENECNETEILMLEYIKTHRELRLGRERAALHKQRKEEQEYRALKKLFRKKRVQDDRENELIGLGAALPPSTSKPAKQSKSAEKTPFFATANRKRKPRRTLGALKTKLALALATHAAPRSTTPEQRPARDMPVGVPAAPRRQPRKPSTNVAARDPTPRRLSELQEELSNHIVWHAATRSAAAPPYPAPESPREGEVHQEAVENVEPMNISDHVGSPLTYDRAREHFVALYEDARMGDYVAEQGPAPLGDGIECAIADSTTTPTHGAASATISGYEFPQRIQPDATARLVNPFRLLDDIAPMGGAPEATCANGPEVSYGDDEFFAMLVDEEDEARSTVTMRFTRRPGVSSTLTSGDDIKDAATPGDHIANE